MHKISIVLPVKNGDKYLSECLESILSQSVDDFELLAFDDNSTDRTLEILHSYSDRRIKIFRESGLINNLNKGIALASGLYIARMDADDIMHPERLQIQLKVMENSDVTVCGSWIYIFGDGIEPRIYQMFSGTLEVKMSLRLLQFVNIMSHPTVMIRREFLIRHNLRYINSPHTEDYRLWFEIAKLGGIFHTVPEALVAYRISNEQDTKVHQQEVGEQSASIRYEIKEYLDNNLQLGPNI